MTKVFLSIVQKLGLTAKLGRMKDPMSIALLGGLLGTIAMDILNLLLYTTKLSENTLAHIGGSMIVSKHRSGQAKNIILGQLWHMITGIGLGLPMMVAFQKTGINNYRIKGAFLGAAIWGVVYNLGQRLRLYSSRSFLTRTHYSYLLTDVLYGLVTAETIKQFTNPQLFADSNLSEQEEYLKTEPQNLNLQNN